MSVRASKEYLDSLQPGDTHRQVETTRFAGMAIQSLKVVRRTRTQIVLLGRRGEEVRARASDGKILGEEYMWLRPATPAEEEAFTERIKRSRLCRRINDFAWSKAPVAMLEAVVALIDAEAKE